MNRILIPLFFITYTLFAQPATERDLEIAAKFEYRSHNYEGITLPFRLFVPEDYDSTKSYPLVLTMHGSGERGTDNNRQILDHRIATSWADSINQEYYPCFVVSPQVPTSGSWVDFYNVEIDRVPASIYLLAANDAVTLITEEFSIDTTRLYATGLSMGGYGTWDLILRFPDRYACAIPMSGGSDRVNLGNSLHTPIWNFHGRQDAAVGIDESTQLFDKFNSFGRETMYTHCSAADCSGLTEQEIQSRLNSGDDLIHTEYENGGHVIWVDSYDYPLLIPWVFRQYFIKNAITETSLQSGAVISNQHDVDWIADNTEGTVDLYYSKNLGVDWQIIDKGAPAITPYQWNTTLFDDASFAIIKLVKRDANLTAYSYTDSEVFTLDNEGNGTPYIGITNKQDFDFTQIETDDVDIEFLAADPEWENLNLTVSYSSDNGANFQQIHSADIESSRDTQSVTAVLSNLQNSLEAVLKLHVSDGEYFAEDYTYRFIKDTPRNVINELLSLEKTNFDNPFDLLEVNPSDRNDHKYVITFDDTSSSDDTYYTVIDNTTQNIIAENEIVQSNSESIAFGGISFITSGEKTSIDDEQTGWNEGSSQESPYTITRFFVNDSHPEYDGYAAPFDYQIEYYDEIVGTSIADTLANLMPPVIFPALDVDFKVKNISKNEYVDFVYFTTGNLVKASTIYFVEDIRSSKKRTWRTVIYGGQDDFAGDGDTLFINTYKALSIFDTVLVDPGIVSVKDEILPENFTLYQNYPNPFNPTTMIQYSVSVAGTDYELSPSQVAVKLVVYDILGSVVATLVNERQSPGTYEINWNASGQASGVYFYRLTAGRQSHIRKMILLK